MKHIKKTIFRALWLGGLLGAGACSSAQNPEGVRERRPVLQTDLNSPIFDVEDDKGVRDERVVPDLIADTNDRSPIGTVALNEKSPDHVGVNADVVNWVDNGVAPEARRAPVGGEGVVGSVPLPAFPSDSAIDSNTYYLTLPQTNQIIGINNFDKHYSVIQNTSSAPMTLTVQENALFWAQENGCIYTSTTAGFGTQIIACDAGVPTTLAVSENVVYWATSKGTILKATQDGDVEKIAVSESVGSDLLVSNDVVYWSDEYSSQLKAVKVDGGAVVVLTDNVGLVNELVQDSDFIYGTSSLSGAVFSYDKSSGVVKSIATQQSSPGSIGGDKGHLYWANNNPGSIIKYKK